MKFCMDCGSTLTHKIPEGDDRERAVCGSCGAIHYRNPKLVVGCIPVWEDRVLLCRRAIEPRHGFWTLPAGYMEIGETVADGARRETLEEAGAEVVDLEPFGIFNITHVGQVYLMFRSSLATPDFSPGYESLDVKLFREADIPWKEMAFTVIVETLKRFFEDRKNGRYRLHMGDILPIGPVNSDRPSQKG